MNDETIELWLNEIPPSDNLRFVGKRRVLSPRAREYYEYLTKVWTDMRLRMIKGWVLVRIIIIWPDRRRRDPANIWKVLGDALVRAGAIEDDCRILPVVEAVYRAGEKAAQYHGGTSIRSYDGGPVIPPAIGREGGLYLSLEPAELQRVPLEDKLEVDEKVMDSRNWDEIRKARY